jgi:hypothetical protein
MHGNTIGTETRTITVTFQSSASKAPDHFPPSPRKCAKCEAIIIGPSGGGCPACGRPLEAAEEDLPKILEVDQPPRSHESGPGLAKPPRREKKSKGPAWKSFAKTGLLKSPWWLLSLGLHMLIFLFLAQIVFMLQEHASGKEIMLSLYDSIGPEEGPGDGEDEIDEGTLPEEEAAPEELDERVETPIPEPEADPAPGAEKSEEDSGDVGIGAGEESGRAGEGTAAFKNRWGASRGDALRRFGGNSHSERAVMKGLDWLARHQNPRGCWSGSGFEEWCRGEPCKGLGSTGYEIGHTGLALLCFLGAGHTHRKGRYAGTVGSGISYFLSLRRLRTGWKHPGLANLYNFTIYCLALAEAFGMTKDPRLKPPLVQSVKELAAAQQKGGGWDYVAAPTGRSDVSVTGWAVMALRSGGAAGAAIPGGTWRKAMGFMRRMTSKDGQLEYEDRGYRGRSRWIRRGPGMAAVGLLCHLYFGDTSGSVRVASIVKHLKRHEPNLEALREDKLHTNYYWYYATMAFFMVGGEDWYWWNERFRDLAVRLQCQAGCAEGSWNPDDGWMAPYGGRLYATCMNLLSLEVYYRYLPLYQSQTQLPFTAEDEGEAEPATAPTPAETIRAALDEGASSGARLAAMQALEKTKGVEAREALESLLSSTNDAILWQAIKSLGVRRERESAPALLTVLPGLKEDLLPTMIKALGRIGGRPALQALLPFLTHGEERVRRAALRSLRGATGEREGLNPERWAEIVKTGDF